MSRTMRGTSRVGSNRRHDPAGCVLLIGLFLLLALAMIYDAEAQMVDYRETPLEQAKKIAVRAHETGIAKDGEAVATVMNLPVNPSDDAACGSGSR